MTDVLVEISVTVQALCESAPPGSQRFIGIEASERFKRFVRRVKEQDLLVIDATTFEDKSKGLVRLVTVPRAVPVLTPETDSSREGSPKTPGNAGGDGGIRTRE